jgi:hypothetical protein
MENAFREIKEEFYKHRKLKEPDIGGNAHPFIIFSDAEEYAVGSVLIQMKLEGNFLLPVKYLSKVLNKQQRLYGTLKRIICCVDSC